MNRIPLSLSPTRNRPVNIFLGMAAGLAAVLLLLALATYRASDPSMNTAAGQAGPHSIHNWVGLFGAWTADLMLQSIGIAGFLIPLWLGGLGWSWIRSRSGGAAWLRWLGTVLALAFVPAVLALVPRPMLFAHALPVEGVTGRLLAGLLVAYLNLQGAWIVAGALAACGLYFASALSIRTLWETLGDRHAQLSDWHDRWLAWREQRAERKAARQGNDWQEEPEEAGAPAQAFIPGASPEELAAHEERAESLGRRPSRLAALFGRHRRQETDPLEDVPAYQRVRFEYAEPEPAAEAPAEASVAAAAPEPERGSIWERKAAPAAAPAEPAETPVPINPMPRPVAARAQAPAEEAPTQAQPLVATRMAPRERPAAPQAPATQAQQQVEIQARADAGERHVAVAARTVSGFRLPPSTLLSTGDAPLEVRKEKLRDEAKVLEAKCAEFDVRGQVVAINPGPMVTTYEFKLENGVKYSRVTSLAEDLCLAMRAESILIERMPGKNTVGIQVPNHDRETIHLRDVIESEEFAKARSRLTMALGKDINGRIVPADLATMPHLLIAGSTGSGKSVAINSMIMSLLFRTTPEQVRLILVDPKRVELGMYEGVPHLFTPIITEPKLAANALRNAVREMERRYKVLASRSVRNIEQYNKLFEGSALSLFGPENGEEEEGPLPYLVIIIDELADLMMLDKANVEESITRLAQMARAVGIHLVLATQRPSVDVITGLIKANVPTRISFRLSSKVDSRTILDTNGAEALLGRGDMLFLPPGTSRLQRLHAAYVSEKETAAVVGFWKAQGEAEYAEGFTDSPRDEQRALEGDGGGEDENDPLFDDAVRLVFEFGKASTSLLQRRLRIGYGRAAHLIDLMERDGLVGPADGSRPRELLKSPGWLHEVPAAME